MPIDTHVRVAAWIHIVMGVLATGFLLLMGTALGVFGAAAVASGDAKAGVIGWLVGLGAVFFIFFIALAVLEIVGGVLLLRGSATGRVITIVYSVLSLLNFPIGTAAGVYSLWALLRAVPRPAPADLAAQQGVSRPY